jgi:hypothetical protein
MEGGEDIRLIQALIQVGEKRQARRRLRSLLDQAPTPELWMLAARACEDREQELGCVRQALKLDPEYAPALTRVAELEQAAARPLPLPPMTSLVRPQTVNAFADREEDRQRARRSWNRVYLVAVILLSLSSAYFVLTYFGSPIPAQIRQWLSGEQPSSSRPDFGRPVGLGEGDPAVEMPSAPGGMAPGTEATPGSYATQAASEGVQVRPQKTEPLSEGSPASDVLDAGFLHEYTFDVAAGAELALAVQFFSPSAKVVSRNVAILDPDGYNAEALCERSQILVDGSSVAFICAITRGGQYKVQIWGQPGESTGVYVVTYDVAR